MRFYLTIITVFISCFVIFNGGDDYNNTFDILLVIQATICSVALFTKPEEPFSLHKIFHLFYLFFFCIAPAIQHKDNISFLSKYSLFNDDLYIKTSFLLLIGLLIYDVIYYMIRRRDKPITQQPVSFVEVDSTKEFGMIAISVIVFIFLLYKNKYNLLSLFFRGGEYVERRSMSNMANLILYNYLRPMTMILYISTYYIKLRHRWVRHVLFILVLITCPITGMPRYAVAEIYLPIVLLGFPLFRKQNVFVLTLIIGLLVVFPFLNNFRHYSGETGVSIGFNYRQFDQLHFDAFSMFMRVLKDNVITNGKQLLGVLLFFVPRTMWPTKPVGSGAFIAHETNMSFSNVSMPIFAEGYINYGYIGLVIFAIIIAIITAKADQLFWLKSNHKINDIAYFILCGLLFFIVRGDLMSSIAYTCGAFASFYSIRKTLFRTIS